MQSKTPPTKSSQLQRITFQNENYTTTTTTTLTSTITTKSASTFETQLELQIQIQLQLYEFCTMDYYTSFWSQARRPFCLVLFQQLHKKNK